MQNTKLQITVRGLDPETKARLTKKAAQGGLSLNKYSLAALKQAAGTETSEERYQAMKQFFENHPPMTKEDAKAVAEAIAWSKKSSLEKQKKDEHDFNI